MFRCLVASCVLAAGLAAPIAAQQPAVPSAPQSLGLADAIDLARQYNPSFRQITNDQGPANWGVRNAYSELLIPSLTLNGSMSYRGAGSQQFLTQEFVQPSATIGSGYSLNLNWRLSGATLSQPGLAKAQAHATAAAIDGAGNTLQSLVTQQYLAVLQARAQVDLAQLQLTRNDEFLRLAQARFQVGQSTMLDVRQAEVAKGQSEVGLLQARQLVLVEKLRLFQQMGIPAPDDPAVVSLTDTFPVVQPTWNMQELLAAADNDNPDVNTLRARAAAAGSSERAAKSEWLPSLSFSAGWSGFTQQFTNGSFLVSSARQGAQSSIDECEYTNSAWLNPGATPLDCSRLALTPADEADIRAGNSVFPFNFTSQPFSASVSLSLPIFTQFSRPLRVSQASTAADDARESVQARRLQVRTDVSNAFYGLEAAYETIEIQRRNRVAAQEQLRLATERYRVGSGTFFELLDAQLAEQRAQADYINAVYAYHRSVAALESAVGRPLR
ncbi:MAG TPA: TolC family protein [Gemmatimonadales bacterium]